MNKVFYSLIFLVILTESFVLTLSAQPAPPKTMTPSLSEVFPLAKKDGSVIVSSDVLLGEKIILTAGTILLNIHAPALVTDRDTRIIANKDRLQDSYSRERGIRDNQTDISPQQRAANKRTSDTEWTEMDLFRAALKFIPAKPLSLSTVNPETRIIQSIPIGLFEGLFLVDEQGSVKVKAVESSGRGQEAGFQAEDIITAINDENLDAGLDSIVHLYEKAKLESGTKRANISFSILRDGEKSVLILKAPISLNSSFF